MNVEQSLVMGLMLLVLIAMASNRARYDFIALAVVLALMVSGILTPVEALSGFGDPVVILIAALLVVGEMLDRTGVARLVGDGILRYGAGNHTRLLVLIMVAAALLSAVMSSTAVVAIFIPILLRIARQTDIHQSQLLLPMSYAALVSGMLTLIATPPNLVISAALVSHGYAALGFFSFSLLGVIVLLAVVAYMLVFGRRWLGGAPTSMQSEQDARPLQALWRDFQGQRALVTLRVGAQSRLSGLRLGDARLHKRYGMRVLHLVRPRLGGYEHFAGPDADFELQPRDTLLTMADEASVSRAASDIDLTPVDLPDRLQQTMSWEAGAMIVLIHPNSRLLGRSIKDCRFRSQYGLDVSGIRRNQEVVDDFVHVPLKSGDSLLVTGPWRRLRALRQQNNDFVVLESPREASEVVPAYQKMWIAIALVSGLVLCSVLDVIPLVAATLIAAIGGVVTRCLSAADAYRAIQWPSLVLLAGMLPLALALEKTGVSEWLVTLMLTAVGDAGPQAVLTLLFFVTVLLTNILSNTTSAVLMVPIAIGASETMGVSPYPLALTLLLAASSAFLTPVASPVVTLVVEPGGYRFQDFLRLGAMPVLLVFLVVYWVVPVLFPW